VANELADPWAVGDAYERYVGRWSRIAADAFVDWLAWPPGGAWLDVGCGTGALSASILRRATPTSVTGVDSSLSYVKQARRMLTGDGARFSLGRAEHLPVRSQRFDVVVSALALNFVPAPEAALAEMVRVARLNGLVAAYVWDYADGMQLMRTSGTPRPHWIRPPHHWTRAGDFRCAIPTVSTRCFDAQVSTRSRRERSTCRHAFETSMTTGRPSSADKGLRRGMSCR
jgi:ubiquinone/menaquinone biosynthesis C-methylase UbiE